MVWKLTKSPKQGVYPRSFNIVSAVNGMTNYNLRQASESDKARIFESYRITVGPYVAQAWGWDESFQHKNFWTYHPLEDFKIIELDNSFVGGLHIEEEESDLVIRMIFLLPDFQRLGIGSQLLTDLLSQARQ